MSSMSSGPASRAAHRLVCGRLAGVLFLVGSLASIPVNQLFEPGVEAHMHLITAVGVLSGGLCLVLPWDRFAERWLHVVPVIAVLEVLLTMWGVGRQAHAYAWFLVFIVVFAAFAFDNRHVIAAHVGLSAAAAAYPALLVDGGLRQNRIAETLVAVPILLVAAAVVVHLRERLSAAVDALADDAYSDALTGVGNYRLLESRLAYEVTRHRRNGRPLSVVVLDLDGFKEVNDTLGHPVGDRLLREVADVLRATVRDQDTVVRQGGDEFCVLAPETSGSEAEALANRVKLALRRLVANGEPLSASAGHATFPDDASSGEVLLAHADLEQRRDKALGRGRRGLLRAVR
jgi:diguanylate cyclase (GGDEF)-like protein